MQCLWHGNQKDPSRTARNVLLSCMSEKEMKKIGLTGVMGAGKSSVIEILKEADVTVLDCDAINADLLKKGNKGYQRLVEVFSDDILNEQKELDNRK